VKNTITKLANLGTKIKKVIDRLTEYKYIYIEIFFPKEEGPAFIETNKDEILISLGNNGKCQSFLTLWDLKNILNEIISEEKEKSILIRLVNSRKDQNSLTSPFEGEQFDQEELLIDHEDAGSEDLSLYC
jgi:hypothetical protein